jgi:hypothetical protein
MLLHAPNSNGNRHQGTGNLLAIHDSRFTSAKRRGHRRTSVVAALCRRWARERRCTLRKTPRILGTTPPMQVTGTSRSPPSPRRRSRERGPGVRGQSLTPQRPLMRPDALWLGLGLARHPQPPDAPA